MVRIDNSRVALPLALLLVITLILPFAGVMGEVPLATDDPMVAAAALDMAGHPGFSLRLGHEYLRVIPPLYPMTAAMVSHVAGPLMGDFTALRLTSALFSLGTLVLFYFFALGLTDRPVALLALALLATMPGFAFGFSAIGRDPALGFFLMALVSTLARAFLGGSPFWILFGGMATAGAFLTSAWDGLLLAGCLWGTGLVWFLTTQKTDQATRLRYLFFHLSALLALLVLSGAGIATQLIGHPASAIHEGFWMFSGSPGFSLSLKERLLRLLVLTWPWAPLSGLYLGGRRPRTLQSGTPSPPPFLLIAWTCSALPTLWTDTTGVAPLLPPLALMAALALRNKRPGWVRLYTTLWVCAVLFTLFLLALAPGFAPLAVHTNSEGLLRLLENAPPLFLAIPGFLLAAVACLVKALPFSPTGRLVAVTAILWGILSSGPLSAVPVEPAVQPLVTALNTLPHKKTAAFGVDCRLRAALCFYGQIHLLPTNNLERCYDILKGGDPDFDTLLMQSDPQGHLPEALSLVPVTIVKKLPLPEGGSLVWVTGR